MLGCGVSNNSLQVGHVFVLLGFKMYVVSVEDCWKGVPHWLIKEMITDL